MSEGDYDVKRCAKCAALIPASATMCSYCNTTSPDTPLERPQGSFLSIRHGVRVTDVLIVANVTFFVYSLAVAKWHGYEGNLLQWALTGTGFGKGLVLAGGYYQSDVAHGQWWRFLSAAFLHSGLWHIALNMFALRDLGYFAEEIFGAAKFLAIYLLSAVGCTAAMGLWMVLQPEYANGVGIGASGAICGILLLLTVYLIRHGNAYGRALGKSLGRSAILMLGIGFLLPLGSTVGHVGGAIVGTAAAFVVRHDSPLGRLRDTRARWTWFAGLLVLVTVVALLSAAWFAVTYRETTR